MTRKLGVVNAQRNWRERNVEKEKKDKWVHILLDMENHWKPFLGDSTNNSLAQLVRGLTISPFTNEELQYVLEQVKEAITKEINTLKDIQTVITLIKKDTRIAINTRTG